MVIDKYKKRMYISMTNFPTFCPVLDEHPTKAVEQVMNALVKNNPNNISAVIKKILEVKHIFLSFNKQLCYIDLLKAIFTEVNGFGIELIEFKEAFNRNISYKAEKHFDEYEQKQSLLNLEFESEKKISFNGKNIDFKSTFISLIEELINQQQKNSLYNESDELLYLKIIPQCEQLRVDSRNIINDEIKAYSEKIETILALAKKYSSTGPILDEHLKNTGGDSNE